MRFPIISATFMAATIGIGSLLGVATPASAQLSNSNLKENLDYTGNRVLEKNGNRAEFLVSDSRYDRKDRFDRRDDRFDRRDDRFDRRDDRFDRRGDRYDRRGDRYDRRGDRYDRRGDRYDRRGDRYDRRYDRYNRRDRYYR